VHRTPLGQLDPFGDPFSTQMTFTDFDNIQHYGVTGQGVPRRGALAQLLYASCSLQRTAPYSPRLVRRPLASPKSKVLDIKQSGIARFPPQAAVPPHCSRIAVPRELVTPQCSTVCRTWAALNLEATGT
jgi:hypothetical protein